MRWLLTLVGAAVSLDLSAAEAVDQLSAQGHTVRRVPEQARCDLCLMIATHQPEALLSKLNLQPDHPWLSMPDGDLFCCANEGEQPAFNPPHHLVAGRDGREKEVRTPLTYHLNKVQAPLKVVYNEMDYKLTAVVDGKAKLAVYGNKPATETFDVDVDDVQVDNTEGLLAVPGKNLGHGVGVAVEVMESAGTCATSCRDVGVDINLEINLQSLGHDEQRARAHANTVLAGGCECRSDWEAKSCIPAVGFEAANHCKEYCAYVQKNCFSEENCEMVRERVGDLTDGAGFNKLCQSVGQE